MRNRLMFMIFGLFLLAPEAYAQTVNAEKLTRGEAEEGFSAQITGSFALRRGNVTVTDIGGGLHGQYQTLHPQLEEDETPAYVRNRWLAFGSARYASNAEDVFVSQSFTHVRWTSMWLKRLGSEVFAQHQFNEFQRLQARVLGGVGARAKIVHSQPFNVALGSGYMTEFERITDGSAVDSRRETVSHRWTSFLNVKLALFEENLMLQNTLYIQPRFDDLSDYRLLEELEAEVAVTSVFSMGTSLTVAHDSTPPAGVGSSDVSLLQTIKFSF